MAKGLSPAQRTLRELRNKGGICAMVERFNPHVGSFGIRQDLFGIIDILVLDTVDTMGIQCCGADFKAHVEKLTVEKAQESLDWLSSPYRKLQIWGWRKILLKRGGKAVRWSPRIMDIKAGDITGDIDTSAKQETN